MDRVPAHRMRSIDSVQFEVQSASVAHHFAAQISPPDGSGQCSAVRTRHILIRLLAIGQRLLFSARFQIIRLWPVSAAKVSGRRLVIVFQYSVARD